MSYCRWSSDNWKCDLYCYEDSGGGWTIHVAGNRIDVELPELPDMDNIEEWHKVHQKQMALLDDCKRVKIDLEYTGESFYRLDLEGFLDKLIELREIGYNFPDYVLKEVREEIKDEITPADPGRHDP